MAVKWIGEAAAELGLDVLEAVEFLASKGNYPMNGLLDEERVQFLKLGKAGNRLESTNPVPISPAAEEKPARRGKGEKPAERGEAAAGPIASGRDRAEDRTAIIQNPLQQAEAGGPEARSGR
jgi:hypothetical protein